MALAPTEVVERMTDAYNRGDLDAGYALLHPDAVDHSRPAGAPPGRDAWRERWVAMRAATPGLVVTVEDVVAEGEMVARRLRSTGRGSDGRLVEHVGMDMVRVRDGLLVEHWAVVGS